MNIATVHKVNNFDLLRIAAALQVLIGHGLVHLQLQVPIWWPLISAFPGVPIFFVISGFLISKAYERSASLPAYARNRALRIYPALWICIFATVAVASVSGFSFRSAQAAAWLPAQLAGLIYTPKFLASFGFGSYNGSLWTIPIELQFYVVLPIIYGLLRRYSKHFNLGLAVLLVLFIGATLAFELHFGPVTEVQPEPTLQKLIRYSFVPHVYLFLAGALMQRLRAEKSSFVAGKGLHWLGAYLVFHFALPSNAWIDVAGTLILAVCVIAVAFTLPQLSQRLLRGNDLSYGTYIYHGLLINVLLLLGWQARPGSLPMLVVLTLVASIASWRFVERPCLRRKSRNVDTRPDAGIVTA